MKPLDLAVGLRPVGPRHASRAGRRSGPGQAGASSGGERSCAPPVPGSGAVAGVEPKSGQPSRRVLRRGTGQPTSPRSSTTRRTVRRPAPAASHPRRSDAPTQPSTWRQSGVGVSSVSHEDLLVVERFLRQLHSTSGGLHPSTTSDRVVTTIRPTCLDITSDMERRPVKRQGEAPVPSDRGGRLVLRRPGGWRACRWRRAVRLICAGWVPQDGAFGRSGTACLASSVAGGLPVAHRCFAGRSTRCHQPRWATEQLPWPATPRAPPTTSTSPPAHGRSRRWRSWASSCDR